MKETIEKKMKDGWYIVRKGSNTCFYRQTPIEAIEDAAGFLDYGEIQHAYFTGLNKRRRELMKEIARIDREINGLVKGEHDTVPIYLVYQIEGGEKELIWKNGKLVK